MSFHTDCLFGEEDERYGPGIVLFCGAPSEGLRFNWPIPGGGAIQVYTCAHHNEVLQERLARYGYGEPPAEGKERSDP